MSRNGELCLKKIIVSYSPSHGDPAVRQFLATHLPAFRRRHPSVVVDVRPRQWPETSLTGVYRDGGERVYRFRGLSAAGIAVRAHRLANDANDAGGAGFTPRHLHAHRRSVQGAWAPWLWGFESARARKERPRWDRRLTPAEWEFYTAQYAAQVRAEEEAVATRVARHTAIPQASTAAARERWERAVRPHAQTDIPYNLAYWKQRHAAGAPGPAAAGMHEYSLFAAPDHTTLGQDAVDMLRRREAKQLENWWRERKEQLKPP